VGTDIKSASQTDKSGVTHDNEAIKMRHKKIIQ